MAFCPTCSGATDVPDGKGGIMPCPECARVPRLVVGNFRWYANNPAALVQKPLDALWSDEGFGG